MGLLAPLYLLGVAAIGLPILFHMIRRVPRGNYPFSTIRFLAPSPPRMTRRSRIEHLLLLFLRASALALLAIAFARPYLRDAAAYDAQRAGSNRIAILVDVSASMHRDGVWAQAVDRALEAVEEADLDDVVGVYAFDRAVTPLLAMEEWHRLPPATRVGEAARRLRELVPGWSESRLDTALTTVADLLSSADMAQDSIEITGDRKIVLVSDIQEGSCLHGLQGFVWPREVLLDVRAVEPDRRANASLEIVRSDDEYGAPAIRVRVHNVNDSPMQKFEVAALSFPGETPLGSPRDVLVPPGESCVVSFPADVRGPGTDHAEGATDTPVVLRLTGDDQTFDNLLYVVQRTPTPLRLLFLGPETDAADPRGALYFLAKAFPDSTSQSPALTAQRPGDALPPEGMASYDLIIVQGTLTYAWASWIRGSVGSGATTALILLRGNEEAATLARLLGVSLAPPASITAPDYAMLVGIDFAHSVFAPFREPRFSDFTKIRVWKYRSVDAEALPGSRVLARFDDGTPALLECPLEQGRVYVLTTSWEPADSQLALSSKFVPILLGLCRTARHGSHALQSSYWVGEEVSFDALGGREGKEVLVSAPDGTTTASRGTASYLATSLPGIYTVKAADGTAHLAVNIHPSESRTAPLEPYRFADLGVQLAVPAGTAKQHEGSQLASRRQQLAAELESRHKLWRWVTLSVLAVLVGESLLAGRAARKAM